MGNERGADKRHRPKCYGSVREWLFKQESFHEKDCPDDDVWPCDGRPADGTAAAEQIQRLADRTEAAAAGASRCGRWRLCWQRPGSTKSGAEQQQARCAARLDCASSVSVAVDTDDSEHEATVAADAGVGSDGTGARPAVGISGRAGITCTRSPPEYRA